MSSKFNEFSKFINLEKKSVNFKKKIVKKFNDDTITSDLNQIKRASEKSFIVNNSDSDNKFNDEFKLITFSIY